MIEVTSRQCFLRLSSISLLYSHNPLRAFVLGGLALMVLAFAGPALSQTQLGSDIDGEAASIGRTSVSLSSDGKRVAIGAPNANGGAGQVRVYEYNGTAWTQLGDDIDGEAADDASGVSVSLSSDGTRVAIGAYLGNGNNSGQVRIYEYNGTAWIQLGADIDGEAADDLTGYSVSLSSDGTRVLGRQRATVITSTCGSMSTMALLGFNSAPTSTARRPLINRATRSPCQTMASGWRLGRLTPTALTQATCGSISTVALLGLKSVATSTARRPVINRAFGIPVKRWHAGGDWGIENDSNGTDSGHVRVYKYSGTAWIKSVTTSTARWPIAPVSLSSDGTRVAIGAPVIDSGRVRHL